MKKFGFAIAAAAILGVISVSLLLAPTPVQAQKKLFSQGLIEELQKIGAPPPAPAPAKAAPAKAPAKMKDDKKK
jgi:hypothetical protein